MSSGTPNINIQIYSDAAYNTLIGTNPVAYAPSTSGIYYIKITLVSFAEGFIGIFPATAVSSTGLTTTGSVPHTADTGTTFGIVEGKKPTSTDLFRVEADESSATSIEWGKINASSGIVLTSLSKESKNFNMETSPSFYEYATLADSIETGPDSYYFILSYENSPVSLHIYNYTPPPKQWYESDYIYIIIPAVLFLMCLVLCKTARGKVDKAEKARLAELEQKYQQFQKTLDAGVKAEAKETAKKMEEVRVAAPMPPPADAAKLKKFKNIFFMSHALPDFPWVQKAVKAIESWPGCYCWYCERDLTPGKDWLEGIYDGLETCNWYVLFWSDKAKASKWTNEEIREAKTRSVNKGIPKITTVNLGCSDWPTLLSRYQGAAVNNDTDLNQWIANLKTQVEGASTPTPPAEPAPTSDSSSSEGWK
jgi:hypothetical protein